MILRRRCVRAAHELSSCSRARVIMPLRAKITNPAMFSAQMSTTASIPKELPGDDSDDVIFGSKYAVRTIELNRPKKLNSLNGSMARKIIPRLLEWEKSDMANVIIMSGAGPKAFCAGGDVAALAKYNQEGAEGQRKSREYFALEYQLDHLMATCKIPYIAYMDGITMGGGVGLSVHAPFRIATERTVFAMPETTIGFFPDVGGSFFLPRLDGFIGTYLALTSEQLRGVDVFYSGIATHYLHSSSLPDLTNRLSELRFQDYIPFKERLSVIAMTINEFVTGLPFNQAPLLSGPLRSAIDRTFSAEDIPTLLSRLSAESGSLKPWADKTLQTLHQRSPTSVHVALRQMRAGAHWGIAETFQREHGLASKFMAHPDFHSGVTARLINKPASTPEWEPPTLESQIDTDTLFAVEGSPRLQLLREGANADYHEYPHRHLGSPREKDVEAVVREAARSRKDVVTLFERQAASVQGIKEIVEEVLRRKTTEEGEGGFCRWVDGYGEEK